MIPTAFLDSLPIADTFTDDMQNGGDCLLTIEGIGNPATSFYNRFVGVREMFLNHDRVSGNVSFITAIVTNEFGEPSVGFIAPDGMYWVIVGR
ncbi:MAG: hypothetical protein SFW36_13285 [Leptolyngbyaceae cyanobacterium bins.59]|nr:hypothetical protein [Leptolyngbyaceae cyanobacterium bins.59]